MTKRHTSVRTDEDSGFDTLWLLKKMDSRSEKTDMGRIRPGDGTTDTRGQHHPSQALGGLWLSRRSSPGLSGGARHPQLHPRSMCAHQDPSFNLSSHIEMNGLLGHLHYRLRAPHVGFLST